MKNLIHRAGLVFAVGIGLVATTRSGATPLNITIPDNATGSWGFTGDSTIGGGNAGIAGEDNETEPGTLRSQSWDLEGFVMSGSVLYMVGGYDFLNGLNDGRPGDLFIKVGGNAPAFGPTTSVPANVQNGAYYDYTYAVDLSVTTSPFNLSAFPSTANAFSLNGNSWLNTVANDAFNSNPWSYINSTSYIDSTNYGTPSTSIPISYTPGLTSAQVDTQLGLPLNLLGTTHNILSLDLAALNIVQAMQTQSIWFSYTMQCGNDSLKGRVPDGGLSAILLGLGLSALSLVRSRRK